MIIKYFEEVETTKEYNDYFCSVAEAITIVLPGKHQRYKKYQSDTLGMGDDWARTEVIVRECEQRGLPLYLTERANHSMEIGDALEDLAILQRIMEITGQYIRGEKL